jgi:hypothetical protein
MHSRRFIHNRPVWPGFLSDPPRMLCESMFDMDLPDVETVCGRDDVGLVDVIRAAVRLESAITAREFAAVAEL